MEPSRHQPETGTADLRRYLSVLRRRGLIILATTAATVVVALMLSIRQDPVYRASVQLLLRPTPSEDIVANQAASNSPRDLTNEIAVVESDVVRKVVEEATNRLIPRNAVSAGVAAEGSDVIDLSATAGNPMDAAELANGYARTYVEWRAQQRTDDLLATAERIQEEIEGLRATLSRTSLPLNDLDNRLSTVQDPQERAALIEQRAALANQLEPQIAPLESRLDFYRGQLDQLQLTADLAQSGGLEVLSEAVPPREPASPQPERDGLVALAVGLMLGLVLAFTVEFLDDSIKDRSDLERASGGLPVLATIPKTRRRQRETLFPVEEPSSNVAEAYRALRTSLNFLSAERPVRVVQVTSARAGEGKTTMVANLTISLAQQGQRVVAVCCDLRHPRLHEFFGVDNEIGLTSALVSDCSATDALQKVGVNNKIHVLVSGLTPPNPAELLGTRRSEEVIEEVASQVDLVVLDCPPVLPVTDALVVSRLADATLVVAAANRTSRRQLHRTVEQLRQAGAPVVGTVLMEVTGEERYGYDQGYWRKASRNGRGVRARRTAPVEPDLQSQISQ